MSRARLGLIAGALLMPCVVDAQSSPSVRLDFTGNYVASTCEIVGSPDMTVTLPTVSTQSLSTSGATAGDTVFTLTVRCEGGIPNARIYFESGTSTDPASGHLNPQPVPGETSATHVQVKLANADGTPIKVGDRNTMQIVPITSMNPTPVNFIASYYATGKTTAGVVSTFVTYVIEMP
ncbi:pilus assembly protein FimA [Burkholderia sp. IDO3]|nr:type 1 fimbrial protein [Burkholderia sp. IDO3]MBM2768261.1 type 1 fimbrial protein [Burkholderia anthina]PCD63170.1 pilus assembly protein FimA [Burkholderia sp. IDO3]